MRFLIDESAGPSLARWLRDRGHDVLSVYEEMRGAQDQDILEKASAEAWILVTTDKDFGDKVYRERLSRASLCFRLQDQRPDSLIEAMQTLLEAHSERLPSSFVVVTDRRVRFARP